MLPLRSGATLADLQRYVAEMEEERGFADSTVLEQSLKLGEEVGELFKAVRKRERLPIDHGSITGTVSEELADVLIYLCAIANREGVSLEDALRSKELLNETRVWTIDSATP
ncbi:MazG nucleotide pyrophosphohydrolase domain-containing protein [Saccharopolyspora phatthalungensis]|uniref:NTP pyrophosphatase (Non-canonical NTP hydrolase) n=1 Tax=Saccharopolyspora phatthalungensis TaxID=664693 RepID=A0A840Q4W0_9PSEU|nr:MazG nucleotide pyrophosphohydrolase domain-containing protein [Saccharopolyspora phatthalungensis]MBB5154930.1 NTP pyrophosphatase (non-canonical NTP hydrolase) [Saccharopolyspora phatthalungensis]